MTMTPSAQRKAQEELDSVVGRNRLPVIEDIQHLPYIQATLMEVMRWATIVPLGLPHRSIDQDEYRGYFIPSGSVVIAVRT